MQDDLDLYYPPMDTTLPKDSMCIVKVLIALQGDSTQTKDSLYA